MTCEKFHKIKNLSIILEIVKAREAIKLKLIEEFSCRTSLVINSNFSYQLSTLLLLLHIPEIEEIFISLCMKFMMSVRREWGEIFNSNQK